MLVTQLLHGYFSSRGLRKPEGIELIVRGAEAEIAVARAPDRACRRRWPRRTGTSRRWRSSIERRRWLHPGRTCDLAGRGSSRTRVHWLSSPGRRCYRHRAAVVCQRTCPVTASSPLQTPLVGSEAVGHGTKLLLALAVKTRMPSTAEPHCKPPAVPPGPAWVTHTYCAGVGIERPVLAALLPGTDQVIGLGLAGWS